ncbi:hypothetical protein BHE90_006942 [Fusarium euwallaceae]|uniref:Uncharacterized protein n=1 Tax=Fusarium euwallaceae TaxID=1147111 RepID=A0A430LS73_9HYPO|nr:hypothetical protein BHE90_006942 [Fusarium euwallaceae]
MNYHDTSTKLDAQRLGLKQHEAQECKEEIETKLKATVNRSMHQFLDNRTLSRCVTQAMQDVVDISDFERKAVENVEETKKALLSQWLDFKRCLANDDDISPAIVNVIESFMEESCSWNELLGILIPSMGYESCPKEPYIRMSPVGCLDQYLTYAIGKADKRPAINDDATTASAVIEISQHDLTDLESPDLNGKQTRKRKRRAKTQPRDFQLRRSKRLRSRGG